MAQEPSGQRLSRGQKVGFSFMLLFAFLAVGLGMIQMRTTIYGPFVRSDVDQSQAVDQAQLLFDESVKLQRIDTDRDGLNDFEELNFYQTSAYLPDTDSDGISDKKEIDDGTDPLCPEGKDCGLGSVAEFSTETQTNDSINPLFDEAADTNIFGGAVSKDGTPAAFDLGSMLQDPTQLRAALLASGQVSAEDLARFTDDQLLDMAQQTLAAQNNTEVAPVASEEDVSAAQLETLLEKPDELRTLLLSTGKMTEDQLDQIDDETLIAVTKELIAAEQQR